MSVAAAAVLPAGQPVHPAANVVSVVFPPQSSPHACVRNEHAMAQYNQRMAGFKESFQNLGTQIEAWARRSEVVLADWVSEDKIKHYKKEFDEEFKTFMTYKKTVDATYELLTTLESAIDFAKHLPIPPDVWETLVKVKVPVSAIQAALEKDLVTDPANLQKLIDGEGEKQGLRQFHAEFTGRLQMAKMALETWAMKAKEKTVKTWARERSTVVIKWLSGSATYMDREISTFKDKE